MSDFGLIWRPFRKYLQIKNFFQKFSSRSLSYLNSPLTSCIKSEKSLEQFLRKLRYQLINQPTNQPIITDFGLIVRPFCEYLQIKNFFQKSGSVAFLPLQCPNFMEKIRKILRAASERTALPTNQTTNQLPTTPILQDVADAGPTKVFYTYFHT